MPKDRRKIVVAGSLWMAVQYTAIHTQNQMVKREARAAISNPARESLNAKTSWQRLMLVLAANFHSRDLVVTLSYRDENLPPTREKADQRLSYFIRNLREYRKRLDKELVYVRITEGYHSDGRLHHHLIINTTGEDYSAVCSLWSRDGDNVDFEPFGLDGPERWAKYLTKEPREKGRRYVGDRTWRTSRNVKKPQVIYEYVSDESDLTPPPGAFILEKETKENAFGKFCHMMARLPEIVEK